MPSPQRLRQTLGIPEQLQPTSRIQVEEQPSLFAVLPSSQRSVLAMKPSPQRRAEEMDEIEEEKEIEEMETDELLVITGHWNREVSGQFPLLYDKGRRYPER